MSTMKIYISTRQLDILTILENESEWINSKQLAARLDLSNKTIQNEIHLLNHILPDDWSIKIINGRGYQLIQPVSENVDFRFIDEDRMFAIDMLNSIIYKEVTTLTALSDKLFLSISRTHNKIKSINTFIHSFYQLKIVDRPLRVVGDENAIRRLMYDMNYYVNSKFNENEFFIIEKKDFDIFIATQLHVTLSLYNKSTFYTFLDVTINRIKGGFKSEGFPETFTKQMLTTDLYKRIEPLFPYIEKTYDVHLSNNEKSILYYAFIRTDFHLIESYDPNFFNSPNSNKLTQSFLDFINYLSELFNLDFKQSSPFMIYAFNLYYLNYFVVDLLNLAISSKHISFEEVNRYEKVSIKYDLPLEHFESLIEAWGKQHNVHFSKYLIESLLILIQNFNLRHTRVNIFVVKTHSFVLNDLLITELQREFGNKVNFVAYEPSNRRNFKQIKTKFDFILSDIILPNDLSSIPHIFLSEIMTEKKFEMIHQKISKAIKEKEKLIIHDKKTTS